MRKRKATRPVLESMEDRVVLSGVSAFDPAAEVRSAFTSLFAAHHARATSAHHSKVEATASHHRAIKAAHAAHHHSSTSNSGNTLSNFFKSVFPGL
jgi:hypothetical protein